jgi:hypothetical protein
MVVRTTQRTRLQRMSPRYRIAAHEQSGLRRYVPQDEKRQLNERLLERDPLLAKGFALVGSTPSRCACPSNAWARALRASMLSSLQGEQIALPLAQSVVSDCCRFARRHAGRLWHAVSCVCHTSVVRAAVRTYLAQPDTKYRRNELSRIAPAYFEVAHRDLVRKPRWSSGRRPLQTVAERAPRGFAHRPSRDSTV